MVKFGVGGVVIGDSGVGVGIGVSTEQEMMLVLVLVGLASLVARGGKLGALPAGRRRVVGAPTSPLRMTPPPLTPVT